eukprot:SAG31_NODE_15457_length_754_cov_1.009160_1_plen_164_part_01
MLGPGRRQLGRSRLGRTFLMVGLNEAVAAQLRAPGDGELWPVVKVLADLGREAGTARKRSPQLPTDGHVRQLNWLLWLWPYLNRTPHAFKNVSCRIPDTVVFINNNINCFYFSSKQHGYAVKRKARQTSCTRVEVLSHFLRTHGRCSGADIIAYYVTSDRVAAA